MSTDAERLNRIADSNRRTAEVVEVLERIETMLLHALAPQDAYQGADVVVRPVQDAPRCDPECVHCATWRGK